MNPLPPNPSNPNAPREWVLVVDDDEPILLLLSQQLETMQLEAVTASSGQAALDILDQRTTYPLLALVDVLMPGMDGLTLALKLTKRLSFHSKVAIMSGHLNEDSFWPVDLREVAYLRKPFGLAALTTLVETARVENPRRD